MSRLGERLGAFDRLAPSRDVYERARRGPTREEPLDGSGRTGRRLVAAVVAIAVFVAAAAFAWSAFDRTSPAAVPGATPTPPVPYEDPMGWRVTVPSAWSITSIDSTDKVTFTGAAFSNLATGVASPTSATPHPIAIPAEQMPSGGIEVVITHMEGGPPPGISFEDDTRLPTSLDQLGCDLAAQEACSGNVRGNGLIYQVGFVRGSEPSPEDVAAAEAVVASLRFPRDGGADDRRWLSLGPERTYPEGRGTPTWVGGDAGVIYVMRGPNGIYALDLVPDSCGEGQNQTWDPAALQILIECPDGSEIRYDRFGSPDPSNTVTHQEPLHVHPVIVAWDDTLLFSTTTLDGSNLEHDAWP